MFRQINGIMPFLRFDSLSAFSAEVVFVMEKDSTNWLITVWPNRVKEENGFGIVSFSLKKNSDAFFDSIQIGDRIYIYEQGAAPESKPRIHDGCSSVYARGVCQEICKEENKTQRIILRCVEN